MIIRARGTGLVEGVDRNGSIIMPDANRVLLKVLTLLIAFSAAIKDMTQPGNVPTP
jgi:hypothetical protein